MGAAARSLRRRNKVDFAMPRTSSQSLPGHSSELPDLLFLGCSIPGERDKSVSFLAETLSSTFPRIVQPCCIT